jgi:RNA polymerase sigma factor (sigma-70 family)
MFRYHLLGTKNPKKDCSKYQSAIALQESMGSQSREAFGCMYVLYYPNVLNFVKKMGGQKGDAEDVFQEVLAYLLVKLRNQQLNLKDDTAFGGYITAAAKNIWYQKFKKISIEKTGVDDFLFDNIDYSELIDNEQFDFVINLEQCNEKLSKKEQLFIRLFYYEKLSYQEIAIQMQQTPESLKANRCRIINKLRLCMQF